MEKQIPTQELIDITVVVRLAGAGVYALRVSPYGVCPTGAPNNKEGEENAKV
jgi:hypothetical protein